MGHHTCPPSPSRNHIAERTDKTSTVEVISMISITYSCALISTTLYSFPLPRHPRNDAYHPPDYATPPQTPLPALLTISHSSDAT